MRRTLPRVWTDVRLASAATMDYCLSDSADSSFATPIVPVQRAPFTSARPKDPN